MNIAQIILLSLIALIVLGTITSYRKRKIHSLEFFTWIFFWLIASTVVLFPHLTQIFADAVGIKRGADLILYLGVTVLYFFLYQILVILNQLDHKLTTLAREIAITNAKEIK